MTWDEIEKLLDEAQRNGMALVVKVSTFERNDDTKLMDLIRRAGQADVNVYLS